MATQDITYEEALANLQSLAATQASPAPVEPTPEVATAEPPAAAPAEPWSEEMYRTLIEGLPDAVAVVNGDGVMVLVNRQTEQLFGYARAELLGRPVEVLVPESLRRRHVEQRRQYFNNPHVRPMGLRLELHGRRKDGSLFPVEISLSPIHTPRGALATAVIRDVSAREREAAKFRTLVENIPAVTFIAPLDESAPELYVSPQIEKLLGFTQKEWIEDPVLWHRQLHPEDRERWNRQFAPTCARGAHFEDDYRFLAKDGRVVWVHGEARLVRDAEGRPLFLQGVAFDITDVKQAEAVLLESKADLERRVGERTEELKRSLAELEEKSEELRHFAYRAAHDLRNSLTSLVNWPEKLGKKHQGEFDAESVKWIQNTINGAQRMRRLINGIKGYSEYLQREQEQPAVDTAAAAAEALANLQADLETTGAAVSVGPLPVVTGNHHLLVLLFQNLVGNAIKYRQEGRPPQVQVGAEPAEGGWRFHVRDNGMGIEEKYRERIFVLGERLHSESKIPGNGYGLAICEKVVGRRGGRMWVESTFGEGSTFYFTWPN
jgi:PAS domain S-box-containing protein